MDDFRDVMEYEMESWNYFTDDLVMTFTEWKSLYGGWNE